jgi:hypothetical protein
MNPCLRAFARFLGLAIFRSHAFNMTVQRLQTTIKMNESKEKIAQVVTPLGIDDWTHVESVDLETSLTAIGSELLRKTISHRTNPLLHVVFVLPRESQP